MKLDSYEDFATASGCTSSEGAPATEHFFDPLLVVSLDASGQPLSRYGDACWDVSAMGTDGGQTKSNLYFFDAARLKAHPEISYPNLAALIREQHKALMWLHMDAGSQRSQRTVVASNLALAQLAKRAYLRGISLFDLFCDPEALGEESAELNVLYAKCARALLKTFWRERTRLNVKVDVRLKSLSEIIRLSALQERREDFQTPIIPSRLYCAILANLLGGLDDIEHGLNTWLDAYRQERIYTLTSRKGSTANAHQKRRTKQLSKLSQEMRALGWAKGSMREFIAGRLFAIQIRLMNVVIAFTGMRIGEAQILPLKDVHEDVAYQGDVHHVVNGFSHKLHGGRKKPASWVTSREGHRALVLARQIASAVLEVQHGSITSSLESALLFPSLNNPSKKMGGQNLYTRGLAQLVEEICPLVTQADIDELNAMELERSWMREGIEVGKPWPLTFHQYRRSLSVYAHRSGMVSLPALKGQLQHITDEMRAYYSDGFCRAVNLVFDKEHFSHEWNAAKSESSFLAFSMALLFSDEDLLGEVGGRGAARMKQTVSSLSKLETLKLFRDGKLSYQETVLGGCTALEGCDRAPLEPIPWDCLENDCVNAVVFGKRLSLLINTQETVVATLAQHEHGSVEHRLEADSLRILIKANQRLSKTA